MVNPFAKVAILVHYDTDFYWTMKHFCWYWLARIICWYYDCAEVEYSLRTLDSVNYKLNKSL